MEFPSFLWPITIIAAVAGAVGFYLKFTTPRETPSTPPRRGK
jgi:hypothetical protein